MVAVGEASFDVHAVATGGGPILPGETLTLMIDSTEDLPLLSVAAMLTSTNDGFIAVHSMTLPSGDSVPAHTATV